MPKFTSKELNIEPTPVPNKEGEEVSPIRNSATELEFSTAITISIGEGENETFIPSSSVHALVISEDIDNMYATGKMVFEDTYDIFEHLTYFGTRNKETLNVYFALSSEDDAREHHYKFKMYDITQIPKSFSFDKRDRLFECQLIEEPTYTLFNHKVVKRSFKNMTAKEIILDILKVEGGIPDEFINIDDGSDSKGPIIPSLIVPFWSIEKTINYLLPYVSGGPYKIFTTYQPQASSSGGQSVSKSTSQHYCNVVSLHGLHKGFLNNLRVQGENSPVIHLYVNESNNTNSGYRLSWNYSLVGPSHDDMKNNLAGESVLLYDYFTGKYEEAPKSFGKKVGKVTDIIPEEDKLKYRFDTGDDRYKLEKRNYVSMLGGVYHEAVNDSSIINNGNYLIHESEGKEHEFSTQERRLSMEVEPKPITETKMLNRFYEKYYKQMTLNSIMTGFSDVKIGSIFQIHLPSADKVATEVRNGEKYNEVFTAPWLLKRKVHKLEKNESGILKYDIETTFCRSGIEKSNSSDTIKKHRKI